MEFKITLDDNDDLILDESFGYWLTSVEGLEKPAIRTSEDDWAGRDGGYFNNALYSRRRIIFSGNYAADTCNAAQALRDNLNRLQVRMRYPIFVTRSDGGRRLAFGYLADMKLPLTNTRTGTFQLTFVCPSAFWFDGGDGIDPESGWLEQNIYKVDSGGYPTPYSLPVDWESGAGDQFILNSGSENISPQIVIPGPATNPTIINPTTNTQMRLEYASGDTQKIVIDTENRTVISGGGSIIDKLSASSTWLYLKPGRNSIVFTSDSPSDTPFVTFRWRPIYDGV